jgi:hypothetical protein
LARVHVFEHQGGTWVEVAQLSTYGEALAVEGDTIVIGNDDLAPYFVDVYRRVGGIWVWAQRLLSVIPPGPKFGGSVALQGDRLAVASGYPSGGPGYVRIYRDLAGTFGHVQTLLASDVQAGFGFGASVALSGSTMLVGDVTCAGAVHRFEHDGTSFVPAGAFGPTEATNGFGERISFHRQDALISGFSRGAFHRLGFADLAAYCPATANSTGVPASLGAVGCDSLSGARLTLVADSLPPGVLALAFFGANTSQTPLGDGFQCVGAPIFRLGFENASPSGSLVHDVDFGSGQASHLAAGHTWHFQVLYRDPGSGGARLNLSDALSIGITP